MAILLNLTGAVVASPVVPQGGSVLAGTPFQLISRRGFQAHKTGQPPINHSDGAPFLLPFEGITKVRFLAMSVVGSGMRVKITTAAGADQVIPNSGLMLIDSPQAGEEITAIKIVGVGQVEYLIAGDFA